MVENCSTSNEIKRTQSGKIIWSVEKILFNIVKSGKYKFICYEKLKHIFPGIWTLMIVPSGPTKQKSKSGLLNF